MLVKSTAWRPTLVVETIILKWPYFYVVIADWVRKRQEKWMSASVYNFYVTTNIHLQLLLRMKTYNCRYQRLVSCQNLNDVCV